eukprot:7041917-Heterocapsa_arctica.AAC.1
MMGNSLAKWASGCSRAALSASMGCSESQVPIFSRSARSSSMALSALGHRLRGSFGWIVFVTREHHSPGAQILGRWPGGESKIPSSSSRNVAGEGAGVDGSPPRPRPGPQAELAEGVAA